MKRIPSNIMAAVEGLLAPYGGMTALPRPSTTAATQWMNQKQAAKHFGVCYQTMRLMVAKEVVRARKIGRAVLVDVASIVADNQQQKGAE